MDNPCPKLYSPYSGSVKIIPLGKTENIKIDLGESTLLGFGGGSR